MHARRAHGVEAGYGAAELGLQRPVEPGRLQEPAGAEARILAQALEPHTTGLRQALGGERHARVVDAIHRHHDGAAVLVHLERDVRRLQGVHHGTGVLGGQIREQGPVHGLLHPHHQANTGGDRHCQAKHQRELTEYPVAQVLADEPAEPPLTVAPRSRPGGIGGGLLPGLCRECLTRLRHCRALSYTCIRDIWRYASSSWVRVSLTAVNATRDFCPATIASASETLPPRRKVSDF